MRIFTYLFSGGLLFNPVFSNAQNAQLFINGPDKNISKVIAFESENGKDTISLAAIYEFDKNGLLIKDSQPQYYIEISYKYDGSGRLEEMEELYGESFSNGITSYFYDENTETEKKVAIGYYSETVSSFDQSKNLSKQKNIYIASGAGNTRIQNVNFQYKDGLLIRKDMQTSFYDYEKEPGEIAGNDIESIMLELQEAEIRKVTNEYEIYTYNSKKQRLNSAGFTNRNEKAWEISFEYNNKAQLISETKKCFKISENQDYNCYEYRIDKNYSGKGKITKIITSNNYSVTTCSYIDNKVVLEEVKTPENNLVYYIYKYEYFKK